MKKKTQYHLDNELFTILDKILFWLVGAFVLVTLFVEAC